ncbi:MAG: hypothetical protein SGJ00_03170 [bacterium]|nr:hypothetical protein [bacterium]
MKKIGTLLFLFAMLISQGAWAQKASRKTSSGSHGGNLNLGVGLGYNGYAGNPASFFSLNYEFDVAKNFTLAPFIGFSSYKNQYKWGNNNSYKYYSYHETSIPVGIKGAYYFDELLGAGAKWDFYLGASLGFAFYNQTWENGYYGDKTVGRSMSPLYLAGHIGARYHFNQKIGAFLDLSQGFSTIGLSIKM